MPVEFISMVDVRDATELTPSSEARIDPRYITRYVRALEDGGFDHTLVAYNSAAHDVFTVGAHVAAVTERIRPIIALRPNIVYPTVAAQMLTTLDHLSDGRVTVHIISGGSDSEQARQGDFLAKDERYERAEEFIEILRRAWSETESWSHEGRHYRFENYTAGFHPLRGQIPISFGGSSDAAFRIAGKHADIFGLWGEPLKETGGQIARVNEQARLAGRSDRPRIWVTFRPIVAATDQLAWEKAHRTLAVVQSTHESGLWWRARQLHDNPTPQNVGSQRALEIARRAERHDRALWTATTRVTNAAGASSALVGSYETVAAAILDYVDLGAELVSIRGYDNLNDVIDYGRHLIPLVRQELEHRERTGQRGMVVNQPPIPESALEGTPR